MSMVTLEEVCEKASSGFAQKDIENLEGDYPIYGATGLIKHINQYMQENEYVAVVKDGAGIGRTMLLPGQSSVIGTLQYLLPKQNIIPAYLYYAVKHMHLEKYFSGATIPHIYFKDYKKETFSLPEKSEQSKIVDILDLVERVINMRIKQLDKLDLLVQGRFVEMFGKTPESDYKTLDEVCILITDGTHNPPQFIKQGIPFLLVSNITGNVITYDTSKFISEETYQILVQRTPIEVGDVLLSTVGSYGHPAIVTENRRFCFQRHIALLKPDRNILDSKYLYAAILSNDVQRQIEGMVLGVAQKTLNLSAIKKIMIPVPEMKLQDAFNDFVAQVDKSKVVIQKSIDNLQLLFDSLMQVYFERC